MECREASACRGAPPFGLGCSEVLDLGQDFGRDKAAWLARRSSSDRLARRNASPKDVSRGPGENPALARVSGRFGRLMRHRFRLKRHGRRLNRHHQKGSQRKGPTHSSSSTQETSGKHGAPSRLNRHREVGKIGKASSEAGCLCCDSTVMTKQETTGNLRPL